MSSIVTVQIEGMERIERELNKISSRMRKKGLRKATGKPARWLRKELRKKLNKRGGPSAPGSAPAINTGNLMRSLAVKFPKAKRGNAYAIVGHRRDLSSKYQGRHSHLLEFGTVNMSARPYFRPTFDAGIRKMHEMTRSELEVILYG
jgi:HK97 gp10 family phage protein